MYRPQNRLICLLILTGYVYFKNRSPSYFTKASFPQEKKIKDLSLQNFTPDIQPIKKSTYQSPVKNSFFHFKEDKIVVPISSNKNIWGGAGIELEKEHNKMIPEINSYKFGIYQIKTNTSSGEKTPLGYGFELTHEQLNSTPQTENKNNSFLFRLFWNFFEEN